MNETLAKKSWAEIIDEALEVTLVEDENVTFGEVAHNDFLKSMAGSFKTIDNPIDFIIKEESRKGDLSNTRHTKLREFIGNIRTIANENGQEFPSAQHSAQI